MHGAPSRLTIMALKEILGRTTFVVYARKIKATPRQVVFNPSLLLTTALYAAAAIPVGEYPNATSILQ